MADHFFLVYHTLCSTLDLILNEYKFDAVALTET